MVCESMRERQVVSGKNQGSIKKHRLGQPLLGRNPMREVMTRLLTALIVVLLLLSGRVGAQQPNRVVVNGRANVAANVGQGEAEHLAPMERNPRYKICRDDVLSISFPLSPELNQKLMVQPDGFISLQNAGDVHVEGLTVPEAIEVIQ